MSRLDPAVREHLDLMGTPQRWMLTVGEGKLTCPPHLDLIFDALTEGFLSPQQAFVEIAAAVRHGKSWALRFFVGWVLGFGPDAEVLGPDELRQQVLARIEAAVRAAQ